MFQGLVPFTVDLCFYVFFLQKNKEARCFKTISETKKLSWDCPFKESNLVGVSGEPADDGAERLAGAAGGGRHPLHVQGHQGKGF